MKKFLLKIVVFLVIAYALAAALQFFIDRGLRKDDADYKEWNDILFSRINADVLIQGSSRAYRHISPAVIDSAFHLNSYNLGLSGIDFTTQYYRLLFYLEHNKAPGYIIQNIDPGTFQLNNRLIDYWQFLPYLDDTVIKRAVLNYKVFNWRDLYIPLYKYHSLYRFAYKGLRCNFKGTPADGRKYKGFEPVDSNWNSDFDDFKRDHPNGYRAKLDSEEIKLLLAYFKLCQQKNIKLIFVFTPMYIGGQKLMNNFDSVMSILSNYAVKYNVPFLNYSNDNICKDTKYFYNSNHLNSSGVSKFDSELVNDLKSIIK